MSDGTNTSAVTPAQLGTEAVSGVDAIDHMTEFLARKRRT